MPSRPGGMRAPTEEKALLSDLGKMFHVAKANHKEARNSTSKSAPDAQGSRVKKASAEHSKDTRRGSHRVSQHGGSVWMVLKGGFAPRVVPMASDTANTNARAVQRAVLSEKRRVAALTAAESFIESAWQQARESDLVGADGTPTEDGSAYLAEQYATASSMLTTAPTGGFLHQLVRMHSAAVEVGDVHPAYELSRDAWEDVCTREAAILFRFRTRHTPAGTAEDYFKTQQQARTETYLFATAEPTNEAATDVKATKCIVRIRDSQRQKATAILSTAKAVNYFKSNVGQLLRKELASSRLPRGGAEDGEGIRRKTSPLPQSGGAHVGTSVLASSGKKKRKR